MVVLNAPNTGGLNLIQMRNYIYTYINRSGFDSIRLDIASEMLKTGNNLT